MRTSRSWREPSHARVPISASSRSRDMNSARSVERSPHEHELGSVAAMAACGLSIGVVDESHCRLLGCARAVRWMGCSAGWMRLRRLHGKTSAATSPDAIPPPHHPIGHPGQDVSVTLGADLQAPDAWQSTQGIPLNGRHQPGGWGQRRAGPAAAGAAVGPDRQGVPLRDRRRQRLAGRPLPRALATPRLPLHVRFRLRGGVLSCSAIADDVNGSVVHLANHDVTLCVVSRAPIEKLQAYKQWMGWSFPWASSCDSDFNYNFGVGAHQGGLGVRSHRVSVPLTPITPPRTPSSRWAGPGWPGSSATPAAPLARRWPTGCSPRP